MLCTCPHCQVPLEQVDLDGLAFHVCAQCRGIWLPQVRLTEWLGASPAAVARIDAAYPVQLNPEVFAGLTMNCPECRTILLHPGDVAGSPGRTAPLCSRCGGIWLEAGTRAAVAGTGSGGAAVQPVPTAPSPRPSVQQVEPRPLAAPTTGPAAPVAPPAAPSSDPLIRLLEGNLRFVSGTPANHAVSREALQRVSEGERPYAMVIGCASSRVSPEVIFDAGLGEVFVLREPGLLVDDDTLTTCDAFVTKLHIRLIVVLAHSQCSATTVASTGSPAGSRLEDHYQPLLDAVAQARSEGNDVVDGASRIHARRLANAIRARRALRSEIASGALAVRAAYYDLASGLVEMLDEVVEPAAAAAPPPPVAAPGEPQPPAAPPTTTPDLPSGPMIGDFMGSGPAVDLTQPSVSDMAGAPKRKRADRKWCPECRGAYSVATTFCTNCGVGLVGGRHVVTCLKCHATSAIEEDLCHQCKAPLHPEWLKARRKTADQIAAMLGARPTGRGGSSCAGAIGITILIVLCLTALFR